MTTRLRQIAGAAALSAGLAGLAGPAAAEQIFTEDVIVDGGLCAGNGCVSGDAPALGLLVKSALPRVALYDTDDASLRNWGMTISAVDDTSFTIFDTSSAGFVSYPVVIENDQSDNRLYIASSGNIGLGTSMPQQKLHLVGGAVPALRLEQDTSGGFGNHTWDVSAGDGGLTFSDVGLLSTVPLRIQNGALNSALVLASNGHVGMGTASPVAALHLSRNQGNARIRVEEVNPTTGPRTLLNLQNNGRPEIVMGNTATGGEWSFGAGTNFILKQGAVGTTSAAKTKLFEIDPAGNATLTGQLVTGGTTCGGGCDRVFTERAIIPGATYADRMWAEGHLPHVGPTPEGAPFNVTEKLGGMLNALEHAHVYIAELRGENARLRQRLEALEARVGAQPAPPISTPDMLQNKE